MANKDDLSLVINQVSLVILLPLLSYRDSQGLYSRICCNLDDVYDNTVSNSSYQDLAQY